MATEAEFAKALAHLCALKRTAAFDGTQVRVWYGALGAFPAWVINRAVLTLATSQERFPEFGDVYQLCRKTAIQAGLITEPYCPNGQAEKQTVTAAEIDRMAAALGLSVKA